MQLIITIQNWTSVPIQQVTPTLILPEGMTFVSASSPAGGGTRYGQSQQEIIFNTTEVIRPGERAIMYLVRITPTVAGNANLRLTVASPDLPQPKEVVTTVQIFGTP